MANHLDRHSIIFLIVCILLFLFGILTLILNGIKRSAVQVSGQTNIKWPYSTFNGIFMILLSVDFLIDPFNRLITRTDFLSSFMVYYNIALILYMLAWGGFVLYRRLGRKKQPPAQ
jgi:uncharacterized membrane protein HdeD (DUF308 family)